MMRSTWLGKLFRTDRERARAEFLRVLRRYGGNVRRASIDLGLDRRYVFRILWRESLWHELDAMRAEAAKRKQTRTVPEELEWIERARAALRAPRGA